MKKYEIDIDEKLCKGCYFCIEKCPNEVLTKSEITGPKGYLIAEVYNFEKCSGCRICERICPDFAISVHEVESS